MTALVRPQALQFAPHVWRPPSPWPGKAVAPAFLRMTKPVNPLSSSQGHGGTPHAEARGFGSAAPEKKRRREEDEDKRNGGKDGDGDDDEIPQVVFDRMMRRVVVSVATPIGAGVGLLYVLSVLKEQRVWDVPPWLPFATTLVFFGTSTLGIVYGTLSTSWDQGREGSLLGWGEVQRNWPELWKDEGEEERR